MRFSRLRVLNFRAIEVFEVDALTDFVLIAGPNGCGKPCVFDAVRLLKSVYGGYQANEWMQWFGEFQININDRTQLRALFRNADRPLEVSATVELATAEKEYLHANAELLIEPLVWARVTGQQPDARNFSATAFATQYREYGDQVAAEVAGRSEGLRSALSAPNFGLALIGDLRRGLVPTPNPTMEIVFQTYDPQHLGIIEYHSASRAYQREAIGGVNLDARSLETQRMQQTLYNWQGKYQNVKTELATTYVRDLVAREAGVDPGGRDLNETLKELFQTFFPEKEYLGVQPDPTGGLNFPVRLRSGQVHDINDLSSGEKEVLYGYLRLRNSTPRNSTILLDEPELHLNPALLQGFPDFYHRNLGRARANQLWLVTHSDTLLRQAVGNANYSVFHMTSAATESNVENQALVVVADDELQRATIDLVGDLATYRPNAKVVLFEGGGDSDIDVLITTRLFPMFARAVNPISGGGKARVRDLYEILEKTAKTVGLAERFFVITDKDSSRWTKPREGTHQLTWDAYHIENYLLEPRYVRAAAVVVTGHDFFGNDDEVVEAMRQAAEEVIPSLVLERLQAEVDRRLVSSIALGANPNAADAADAVMPSVEATFRRLDEARSLVSDTTWLREEARRLESALRGWLETDEWIREIPGRSVLKRFVGARLAGVVNYEAFRMVILDQMADEGYEPPGMALVVRAIMGA